MYIRPPVTFGSSQHRATRKLLVDEKLADQEIKKNKITVGEAEVDASLERLKESRMWTDEDLRRALENEGFTPDDSSLIMQPDNAIALGPSEATSVLSLIESLEELDDVTNVYHNLELTDEVVAQFA